MPFILVASNIHEVSAASGQVTMWATTNSDLIGSQCEYANAPVNSLTDSVLPSLLRSGFHCAIGDSNPGFGQGEFCGGCYRLTAKSDTGTGGTPGKAGSAVVMVSNGGAGGDAHFDCILDSFEAITGAKTGIFDVDFEPVPCDVISGAPVVMNWADKNAYYCKMMFQNVGGWGTVKSVQACLNGNTCADMTRAGGATWTGCPQGEGSSMKFVLTQETPEGVASTIECDCQEAWPWATGHRCTCPTNFATSSSGGSTSPSSPTPSSTPSSSASSSPSSTSSSDLTNLVTTSSSMVGSTSFLSASSTLTSSVESGVSLSTSTSIESSVSSSDEVTTTAVVATNRVVKTTLKITNVDYNALVSDNSKKAAFEDQVKEGVVSKLKSDGHTSVSKDHVSVQLSPGSVLVHITVTPPTDISTANVASSLKVDETSSSLEKLVVQKLQTIPDMSDIITGTPIATQTAAPVETVVIVTTTTIIDGDPHLESRGSVSSIASLFTASLAIASSSM